MLGVNNTEPGKWQKELQVRSSIHGVIFLIEGSNGRRSAQNELFRIVTYCHNLGIPTLFLYRSIELKHFDGFGERMLIRGAYNDQERKVVYESLGNIKQKIASTFQHQAAVHRFMDPVEFCKQIQELKTELAQFKKKREEEEETHVQIQQSLRNKLVEEKRLHQEELEKRDQKHENEKQRMCQMFEEEKRLHREELEKCDQKHENENQRMQEMYKILVDKLEISEKNYNAFRTDCGTRFTYLEQDLKEKKCEISDLNERNRQLNGEYKELTSKKTTMEFEIKERTRELHALSRITNSTRWKETGITIAGGNGRGGLLNHLHNPTGFHIDHQRQSIYVADYWNFRIIEFPFNDKMGRAVAGGNDYGNQMNQLHCPTDVVVDTKNNSLIICDKVNRRLVEWSRQHGTMNGQILISNIDCAGITMDQNGYIYVSDAGKDEVRRWKRGDTNGFLVADGLVAGGNGEGNHLNQLNNPGYLFVDEDETVYVLDCYNHRVMKWMKNANEGIIVAGGQGPGNKLTQLNIPSGIIVDHLNNVYVADAGNNRIMCWLKGSREGRIIVGGNGCGIQSNQLNGPGFISFDREDNLYVVEWGNHRVQKFEIEEYE